MKRSEINAIIREAEAFLAKQQFLLPPWAHWSVQQWQDHAREAIGITQRGMGWDVTDFGLGTYREMGLVLFTLRNGQLEKGAKPYAEKVFISDEKQETPFHYHWMKIEDIINRGGGVLELELGWEDESGKLSDRPVDVMIDEMPRRFAAGERVRLAPGESITLPPELYHRFWACPGHGPVLTGEISTVNDDANDNKFLEPVARFAAIEEDEEPYRLLVTDYDKWLSPA